MPRYIDADALVEKLQLRIRLHECSAYDALDAVDEAPTLDFEPVRHGRCDVCQINEKGTGSVSFYGNGWQVAIRQQGATFDLIVNHDGEQIAIPIAFCPECGAKMDETAPKAEA